MICGSCHGLCDTTIKFSIWATSEEPLLAARDTTAGACGNVQPPSAASLREKPQPGGLAAPPAFVQVPPAISMKKEQSLESVRLRKTPLRLNKTKSSCVMNRWHDVFLGFTDYCRV